MLFRSYLIGEALTECRISHELHLVENGEEMLDYLYHRGRFADGNVSPLPGLILLDLNMPLMDGREVLEIVKADPKLKRIPIVVFTNSRSDEDVLRSYDLGVSGFITKPVSYLGLLNAINAIGMYWLQIATLPPQEL